MELLLRLVAEELGDSDCPGCGAPLRDSLLTLKSADPEHAVVEVGCGACGERRLLGVEPGGEGGTASLR